MFLSDFYDSILPTYRENMSVTVAYCVLDQLEEDFSDDRLTAIILSSMKNFL